MSTERVISRTSYEYEFVNMAEIVIATTVQALISYSSTSSDSSSDDEWQLIKEKRKRLVRPRIKDCAQSVVSRYIDYEFKNHFRMQRTTFEFILNLIRADLIRKIAGSKTISPREQLMIAVWKMATIDSFRSICDRFNVGRATALRAVRRVTYVLFKLAPKYISWPSGDKARIVMRKFEEASGFPKTIGAIDGTHIRIKAPEENAVDYINRKGYHSIQLQVVCDHRAIITHCYVGHPGSFHDQRVFRQSEIAAYLNNKEKFPSDSHLVGDSAYELHQHLLVPFKDNGHLTAAQKHYNFRQSSTRVVVERCFALLKGRMRSLMYCLPMIRVDLMAEYIVACCVIHNICILCKDELAIITVGTSTEVMEDCYDNQRQAGNTSGIYKRNMIMDNLQRQFNLKKN